MPDNTQPTPGEMPNDGTPTAGDDPQTPPTTPETTPTQGQDPNADEFDRDRAMQTIRNLRQFEKLAKQQAAELADYKRREDEVRQAQLSEEQKLRESLQRKEAELAMERQQATDRTNRYEVQILASRLGVVDPDAAVKLLDWSALEYDDDGRPKDVEAALKDLIEQKPYLARQAPAEERTRTPQGSPTNPATRQPGAQNRRYTTAEIADRAFWNANKVDIMRAMRENRIDP